MKNSGLREFRISINMGYGQMFNASHLERAGGPRAAATYALRRYFGQQMVDDRFADLVSAACTTYGRRIYDVFTFGDGKTYEKGYRVIVDDVSITDHDELEACPECLCTDIEVSAWVHANNGQVSNSEGPSDEAWCPECESRGYESTFKSRHAVRTRSAKPFQERQS